MTPIKAARWMWGLFVWIVLAVPAFAQTVDLLGAPGPIVLDGKSFELAWSAQPSGNYRKQEYVPAGQSVDHYDQMVMLERVTGGLKVIDAVSGQMDMLENRKRTDPLVRFEVLQKNARDEVDFDFLVSGRDARGDPMVEWNLYRYLPTASGVLLFAISHRAYGNEAVKTFLGELSQLRSAQTGMFLQTPVPDLAD